MDLDRLKDLGFALNGGQVDYKNKNYGTFTLRGAILTDAGEELVERLESELEPKSAAARPAAKAAKPKPAKPAAETAAPVDPAPAGPASTDEDLAAGIGDLLGA